MSWQCHASSRVSIIFKGEVETLKSARSHGKSRRLSFLEAVGKHEAFILSSSHWK